MLPISVAGLCALIVRRRKNLLSAFLSSLSMEKINLGLIRGLLDHIAWGTGIQRDLKAFAQHCFFKLRLGIIQNDAYFWTVGSSQRIWRKPTHALEEHENSTQKPGAKICFLLIRVAYLYCWKCFWADLWKMIPPWRCVLTLIDETLGNKPKSRSKGKTGRRGTAAITRD